MLARLGQQLAERLGPEGFKDAIRAAKGLGVSGAGTGEPGIDPIRDTAHGRDGDTAPPTPRRGTPRRRGL